MHYEVSCFHIVWEDPDHDKLFHMTNGWQGNSCLTCPKKQVVGGKARTHDCEQHFVQYLELSRHHEKECRIEEFSTGYSPCATCSDTLIEYYRSHDDKYKGWRPEIHVGRVYREGNPTDQQLHRDGLKKLLQDGFRLEVFDPQLFLEKYSEKLSVGSRNYLQSKRAHNTTKACLHSVKYNCYHPFCGQFGTEALPECMHSEL